MPDKVAALPDEESSELDPDGEFTELDPDEVGEHSGVSQMMAYMESFSGPLPPPAILERYAATYADAPRIIFETFEKQMLHRHEMERTLISGSEKRAAIGQFLGTGILVLSLLGGIGLAFAGREGIGIAVVGGALTTGILSYVFGDFIPGRKKTSE